MCNLQQRRYIESLKYIQKYKNIQAKRSRAQHHHQNKNTNNFNNM
jgi:hypothetical protein